MTGPPRRTARWVAVAALLATLVTTGCAGAAPADTAAPPADEVAASAPAPATAQPRVVSGAGDITGVVAQYRALFGGTDNGGEPRSFPDGHRVITWDGTPSRFSAPNLLPGDLFNGDAAPTARGAILATPGAGLQVSAVDGEAKPRFGHLNPSYPDQFATFSPERLFSPVGSNIVDLTFAVPGTDTPAAVRGFGAVYTDIDTDHTAFEYFDARGASLGSYPVPIADGGLSFLGVAFDEPIVARVRITYGTVALGPNDSAEHDVAVMDDFLYGEPQALGDAATAIHVGRVEGTTAAVALLRFADGSVRAYLCDGIDTARLLTGTITPDGTITAADETRELTLSATGSGDQVTGTVTLDGAPRPFTAEPATGGAGFYRAAGATGGTRVTVGWVVQNDGTAVGAQSVDGDIVTAPAFEPGLQLVDSSIGPLAVELVVDQDQLRPDVSTECGDSGCGDVDQDAGSTQATRPPGGCSTRGCTGG